MSILSPLSSNGRVIYRMENRLLGGFAAAWVIMKNVTLGKKEKERSKDWFEKKPDWWKNNWMGSVIWEEKALETRRFLKNKDLTKKRIDEKTGWIWN